MVLYNPNPVIYPAPTCRLRPLPVTSESQTPSRSHRSYETAEQQGQEWYQFGIQQLASKQYIVALSAFDQAIALHFDRAEVWYARGEVLANQARYAAALDSFECALALDPNHAASWTFRAVALLHLQRHQDALQSCDRALALCPQDSEAWLFRGVALHNLKRYREAYRSYEQATGEEQPLHKNWLSAGRLVLQRWAARLTGKADTVKQNPG